MGSTLEAQQKKLNTKPKVDRVTGPGSTDEDMGLSPSIPRTTGRYELPINPDTGRPWTAEEKGPMERTPKPGVVNPETGESFPSRGYTTGDKAGQYSQTLEYVPGRDPTEFIAKLLKDLQRNDGGIAKKTKVY